MKLRECASTGSATPASKIAAELERGPHLPGNGGVSPLELAKLATSLFQAGLIKKQNPSRMASASLHFLVGCDIALKRRELYLADFEESKRQRAHLKCLNEMMRDDRWLPLSEILKLAGANRLQVRQEEMEMLRPKIEKLQVDTRKQIQEKENAKRLYEKKGDHEGVARIDQLIELLVKGTDLLPTVPCAWSSLPETQRNVLRYLLLAAHPKPWTFYEHSGETWARLKSRQESFFLDVRGLAARGSRSISIAELILSLAYAKEELLRVRNSAAGKNPKPRRRAKGGQFVQTPRSREGKFTKTTN